MIRNQKSHSTTYTNNKNYCLIMHRDVYRRKFPSKYSVKRYHALMIFFICYLTIASSQSVNFIPKPKELVAKSGQFNLR